MLQKNSIEVMRMEIKRDYYLNKLITKKHNGLIKVVTGMRRCGKSYLLFELFKKHLLESGVQKDHIIEMAFDSFDNKKFRNPEALYPYVKEKLVDEQMYYILLDEVQMVVEGVYSAKAGLALAKKYDVSMPIIEQINRVLFEDKTAAEAVHELMVRDAGRENEDLLWD